MKCEICGKEILRDSQCINYKYYHNDCIENLEKQNKQLKEQLLVSQTNEETFRLEMVDITKILGLDEHTIFDDVKAYVKSLKDNWNKLKKDLELVVDYGLGDESSKWDKIYGEYAKSTLKFMQELEQGSDNK